MRWGVEPAGLDGGREAGNVRAESTEREENHGSVALHTG